MHVQSPARHSSSPAGRWDVGRRSAVAPGRWKSTGSHRSALISLFEPNPGTERLAPKEIPRHGPTHRCDKSEGDSIARWYRIRSANRLTLSIHRLDVLARH